MLARVAGEKSRRPQFVRVAEFLGLAAGEIRNPCLGLDGDLRLSAGPRQIVERRQRTAGRRPLNAALAQAGRKIVLHFLPPYCPHLDPIERLWALMHENVTHNRDYKTFAEFKREIVTFLRYEVPRRWKRFCDRITDNFRVIHAPIFGLSLSYRERGEEVGER